MLKKIMFMPLFSALLGLFSCSSAGYTDLDVDAFAMKAGEADVALIDVRTTEEYAEGHLRGASNVDWYAEDFLDQVQAAYPASIPLAVYCRSGKRAGEASKKLAESGYTVYNMQGGYLAWTEAGKPVTQYEVETFFTPGGRKINVTLIKHASLEIDFDGFSIQVDPVIELGRHTDYEAEFPKAGLVLVTHEHGDHFDKDAISVLTDGEGPVVTNDRCAGMLGRGTAMSNGDALEFRDDIKIEAVPAYNYTEGHIQFHPKGRDNGFILTLDGFRIYIAGDTEDIPEMAEIKDIDLAFLPANQPYTMTVDQCVNAAMTIRPKVLIPYHFSQTDISSLPERLPGIKVLLRQMQ